MNACWTFASRIAGARIEYVDAAGHMLHLEQLDRVAKLVEDFLVS